MAETKTSKQVMDVSKPGKTMPEPTSRPVIVGHKTEVQDPMVTTTEDTSTDAALAEPAAKEIKPSVTKKVVTPISTKQQIDQQTQDVEQSEDTNQDTSSDAAEVDVVAGQFGASKPQVLSEEEKKKQEQIQQLIVDKTYAVPIGKSKHKSSKLPWVLLLLTVLLLVSMYVAVDSGAVDVGITPPVDLIK